MNDQISTLRDDIAFMRELAEEGRSPPLVGGFLLLAAGLVFSLASIGHWAIATGLVAESPWSYLVIWGGALVLFLACVVVVKSRQALKPSAHAPGNRAAGMAWAGVGWGIMCLMVCMNLVCWRAHSLVPLMLLPSMVLTLYGLGWSVAAVVSRQRWIWLVAIGSYVGAAVVAYFSDTNTVYLIYAAALMLLLTLPGAILMRQEPSLIV
jgi:hypothetical protein